MAKNNLVTNLGKTPGRIPNTITPESFDNPNSTYLLFGGGVGKFGQNFSIFRHNNTTLWVDIGAGFPDYRQPGMDRTIPSIQLVKDFPPDAIVLTHGHEDHIGALPYIIDLLKPKTPVYASPFTHSLLSAKFRDVGIDSGLISSIAVEKNQEMDIGDFKVSSFFIPHSIPQTFSIGIIPQNSKDNKKIKMFYTSDFRLNGKEARFSKTDIENFGPVDYLFCDSTGSLSKGKSFSEDDVAKNLESIINDWSGRIFITTFSSQVERIRSIFDVAQKTMRPIGIRGRSIRVHLQAAFESGEFPTQPSQINNPSPVNKKAIWLIAGCQGDIGSSFRRLSEGELAKFHLTSSDLLIYSGSIIPGNSDLVYEALNNISNLGTNIVGISDEHIGVHTSGHARINDIKELIEWLKPKNVTPIHGDAVHFQGIEEIVKNNFSGADTKAIRMSANNIFEITDRVNIGSPIYYEATFVETKELHNDITLYTHRRVMAKAGICTVVINRSTNQLISLQYIGTTTAGYMAKNIKPLEQKIKAVINLRNQDSKNAEKKLKQKISRINIDELGKNPFVNVVWV